MTNKLQAPSLECRHCCIQRFVTRNMLLYQNKCPSALKGI